MKKKIMQNKILSKELEKLNLLFKNEGIFNETQNINKDKYLDEEYLNYELGQFIKQQKNTDLQEISKHIESYNTCKRCNKVKYTISNYAIRLRYSQPWFNEIDIYFQMVICENCFLCTDDYNVKMDLCEDVCGIINNNKKYYFSHMRWFHNEYIMRHKLDTIQINKFDDMHLEIKKKYKIF